MKHLLIIIMLFFSMVFMHNETNAQNFWQGTNGPWLSINYAIYASANGELYVANDSGVYKSTNRGDNWTLLMHGSELPMTVGVTLNTSGHIFGASVGHSVLRSIDSGKTWTEHSQGIDHKTFHCIMIDNNDYLFVGTDSGIFRSIDNGESWAEANTGATNIIVTSMAAGKNNVLYAGTTTLGVYVSTDSGRSWGRGGWINAWINSLAISPEGILYAGNKNGGIYKTIDHGQTWELLSASLPKAVNGLAINSHGHVFAGTDGQSVYRSTNHGTTWEWIYTGMIYSQKIRSMAVDSNDYVYAGSNGNGVYRSIMPTTSVHEPDGMLPAVFSLYQNFPNPFNPSTRFSYQLPFSNYVTLKIINVLGEEVATIIDEHQEAGYKLVDWDASNVPSGIYFYKLEATSIKNTNNSFVQTRKMILIK